jgi:hypothetical protein
MRVAAAAVETAHWIKVIWFVHGDGYIIMEIEVQEK